MSVNRKRNPYTLGNFALQDLPKRRASCTSIKEAAQLRDPFEHDPFKVQSYNFRYADPPGYALQTPFCSQTLMNRNTEMPQSNFRDTRRRRFVQATNYNTNNLLHPNYYQSSASSGSCSSVGYTSPTKYADCPPTSFYPSAFSYLDAPTPSVDSGYKAPVSAYDNGLTMASHYNCAAQRGQTPTRHSFLRNKHSAGSLCEIQIKIKRSEHALTADNVIINIATDKNSTISTTPYQTEGLTINSVPYNSNTAAAAKQSFTSVRAPARRQSKERTRCRSTSSESSSDFDLRLKKSLERVPQFMVLKNLDKKVKEEKQAPVKPQAKVNTIPFVTPPWVLGAKTAKHTQNNLQVRTSNQTLINNLDSQDNKSAKLHMHHKSSSASLSSCAASTSKQPLKRSITSMSNNSTMKVNTNRPRASSTVRNSQNPDKNPLRVNINLYSDKKTVSRV